MKIQTIPSKGPDGVTVYTVTVVEGNRTSSQVFPSKDDVERFVAIEQTRLLRNGKHASRP